MIIRLSVWARRIGSFCPSANPATKTAMAISGPKPSRELKLRAAARLAARVSKKTVIVIEMTRRVANSHPLSERSFRKEDSQISFS